MGGKKKTGDTQRQALYRKYRSRSLNDVIGQEHITKTLSQAIATEKLSHAYLFTGPRGTGKTSVARILAHEINQLPYTDDTTHLDIIEIDAASNRRIDDIRDLRDKVHIAPLSAPYKVYIIDEVHMLTTESFNALLKTLEEPPKHVIFILATTEIHKLPATIVSRTQRHSFRLIPQEKIVAHLGHIAEEEGISIDDEALQLLAEHGGGSFRDSISLLDQMGTTNEPVTAETIALLLGIAPTAQLNVILQALSSHNTADILTQINEILAQGVTPAALADQLVSHIRQQLQTTADQQLIHVMHDLLEVALSHYPRMKLEAVLLKHAIDSDSSAPPPSSQPALTTKQPEVSTTIPAAKSPATIPPKEAGHTTVQKKSVPSANKKPATTPTPNTITSGTVIEKWPEILSTIRTTNNPLYTILRLATPQVKDDELHLAFQFPFHQKRVDDTKYKSLLSATIFEHTGSNISVVCVIDKAGVAEKNSSAHASHLAAVQDIMGGGEIVHG